METNPTWNHSRSGNRHAQTDPETGPASRTSCRTPSAYCLKFSMNNPASFCAVLVELRLVTPGVLRNQQFAGNTWDILSRLRIRNTGSVVLGASFSSPE